MSLLDFVLWLQSTDFFTALRFSEFVYPIILTGHLVGIAFFAGMILVTDLRLLGVGLRKWNVSDVVGQLRVPKRIGLVLVASCGLLLFGSKAEEYYYNAFFRAKLALLALIAIHALTFRRQVYANLKELDRAEQMPRAAKWAGGLSVILWLCMIIAGRGIGYIETPDFIHARNAQRHRVEGIRNLNQENIYATRLRSSDQSAQQ
jgi:uncharacterized membrane protein